MLIRLAQKYHINVWILKRVKKMEILSSTTTFICLSILIVFLVTAGYVLIKDFK
jgi:hypothetical protein